MALCIKTNIDLKELEKFGFEKLENDVRGHKYSWKRQFQQGFYELYVNKDNNLSIQMIFDEPIYQVRIVGKLQSKIYDLIKANIVECVEDES